MNVRYSFLVLLFTIVQVAAAQQMRCDTIFTTVNFKRGHSDIDLDYKGNRRSLEELSERLDSLASNPGFSIDSVVVSGFASPDGLTSRNIKLAEKRARNIADYLMRVGSLPEKVFSVESAGVDWEGLYQMVDSSSMPYREEVLEIIRTTPVWVFSGSRIVDGRKRRLGMLHGGKPYKYMAENFFPFLRHADFRTVVCMPVINIPPSDNYVPDAGGAEVWQPLPEERREVVVEAESRVETVSGEPPSTPTDGIRSKFIALKTNLLYDLAAVPSIGVEVAFAGNYSAALSGLYAWWSKDASHRYWRVRGGELELRRWWLRNCPDGKRLMSGHHIGIYAQLADYDLEFGGKGYQSAGLNYGAGIAYGYSLPLGSRLNIEFSIGFGWFGGEYRTYRPADGCYVWQSTNRHSWVGPTKAGISLVWKFGPDCRIGKGGGR